MGCLDEKYQFNQDEKVHIFSDFFKNLHRLMKKRAYIEEKSGFYACQRARAEFFLR